MLERKIRDEVKRLYSDTRHLTLKSIRTALNCKERGDYFVLYAVALKINGMIIDDEDELASLLPSFEY